MKTLKRIKGSILLLLLIILPFALWNDWRNGQVSEAMSMIRPIMPPVRLTSQPTATNTSLPTATATAQPTIPATNTPVVSTAVPTATPSPFPTQPPTQTPVPIYGGDPIITFSEVEAGVMQLGGFAMPSRTVSILTNRWTVGVTTTDEFGRWQFPLYFTTRGDYEIFVRELDSNGIEVSASDAILIEIATIATLDQRPDEAVRAVQSGENRCEGVNQPGVLLPFGKYQIGVCQTLGEIALEMDVAISELLAVNTHLANPSLIHPGQIINLP